MGGDVSGTGRVVGVGDDLHRRADVPVRDFADVLIDPLLGYVPSLAKATAENGENLIHRARNAPDCYLGELMAHVALALQNTG